MRPVERHPEALWLVVGGDEGRAVGAGCDLGDLVGVSSHFAPPRSGHRRVDCDDAQTRHVVVPDAADHLEAVHRCALLRLEVPQRSGVVVPRNDHDRHGQVGQELPPPGPRWRHRSPRRRRPSPRSACPRRSPRPGPHAAHWVARSSVVPCARPVVVTRAWPAGRTSASSRGGTVTPRALRGAWAPVTAQVQVADRRKAEHLGPGVGVPGVRKRRTASTPSRSLCSSTDHAASGEVVDDDAAGAAPSWSSATRRDPDTSVLRPAGSRAQTTCAAWGWSRRPPGRRPRCCGAAGARGLGQLVTCPSMPGDRSSTRCGCDGGRDRHPHALLVLRDLPFARRQRVLVQERLDGAREVGVGDAPDPLEHPRQAVRREALCQFCPPLRDELPGQGVPARGGRWPAATGTGRSGCGPRSPPAPGFVRTGRDRRCRPARSGTATRPAACSRRANAARARRARRRSCQRRAPRWRRPGGRRRRELLDEGPGPRTDLGIAPVGPGECEQHAAHLSCAVVGGVGRDRGAEPRQGGDRGTTRDQSRVVVS